MSEQPLAVIVAARALDGLSMRMAALANNIANAGSPNFRASKIEFEQALQSAAREGAEAVRKLEFRFQPGEIFQLGDDRRVDLVLADAASTSGRYAAVADMIGRRFAIEAATLRSQQ